MSRKPEANAAFAQRVESVRLFNRFYTRHVGALGEHLLDSPFSLAEARVIYELANRERPTASLLSQELTLDPGYLSRILRRLKALGLVDRGRSEVDRRQGFLWLTDKGKKAFEGLNDSAREEIAAHLGRLSPMEQEQLIGAMTTIQSVMGGSPAPKPRSYVLRPHQPGDMGWVVQRHGVLYSREYGWDEHFEALVATIVAKFIQDFDPAWERCWIAEVDGEPAGSVFLVKAAKTVAQLRLLLVEPSARGLGIGKRLVDECVRFARRVGYRKLRLWTQSNLVAARHLYVEAGFQLTKTERHQSFGANLVGETWELDL